MRVLRLVFAYVLCAAVLAGFAPGSLGQAADSPVLQMDVWRKALLSGDSAALAPLYADSPRIIAPGQKPSDLQTELAYWTSWKSKGLKSVSAEVSATQEPQPGFHVLIIQLTLEVVENGSPKKYYVRVGQGYIQQGATWKIAGEQREVEARIKPPVEQKDLYPAGVNAEKEISEALESAAKSHKRVLLIFGGNWCYDCHVLDAAFHTPEIAPTLNKNFLVVHVDIGEYNKNLELAKQYQVPLERGVPAAAVLDGDGKLLFTQKNQEFEKAHALGPEDILAFLNKWKPVTSR